MSVSVPDTESRAGNQAFSILKEHIVHTHTHTHPKRYAYLAYVLPLVGLFSDDNMKKSNNKYRDASYTRCFPHTPEVCPDSNLPGKEVLMVGKEK